jgi:peptide-methionine (S)-S-oxide reductase
MPTEYCTLAGGCFWCTEAALEQLLGVHAVLPGYAGGDPARANYKAVCTGTTNHAEVIRIEYDNTIITFSDLLAVFFAVHDPTTLNRQGADIGTQYRSAIFYENAEQQRIAAETIEELNRSGAYKSPVVTTLEPLTQFFPAEEYHRGYYRANPYQPYCMAVSGPKAAKARKLFAERIKPEFR